MKAFKNSCANLKESSSKELKKKEKVGKGNRITMLSQKELEKRRIPVHDYVI